MATGIKILDDLAGLGVSDLANVYALVNKTNLDKSLAKSNNLINQLTAQQSILGLERNYQLQSDVARTSALISSNSTKALMIGGVVIVLAIGAFVVLKAK